MDDGLDPKEVELLLLTSSSDDAVNIKIRDSNHGNQNSGNHDDQEEFDGTKDNGTLNCPQPVLVLVLDSKSDVEALCGKLTDLGFGFTILNSIEQDCKMTGKLSDLQFIGIHMSKKVTERYAEELNFHVRFAENKTSSAWARRIPSLLYSCGLGYSGFNTVYYSAPFQSKHKPHYINLDYIYSSRVGAEIVHTVLLRNSVYKTKSYHISNYFVPHTPEKGEKISQWKKMFTLCPLEEVRNYYGEEIAFVYAWNNMWLTLGLVPLAVIGLLCAVYGAFTEPNVHKLLGIKSKFLLYISHLNSNDVCYFYGFFMMIWMAIFQHQWTKISSLLSLEWGTSNFNIEEEPIFKTPNSKTSKISELCLPIPNMLLEMFGFIATCLLTLIIFIITEIIRTECYRSNPLKLDETYLEFTVTCICSVFYSVFNLLMFTFIIPPLVNFVTDMENHRFRTFYDNSIIFKYGGYYIISSYLYLIYLIFFRNNSLAIFGINSSYLLPCKYGICSVTICQELLVQIIVLRFVCFAEFGVHKLKVFVRNVLCGGGVADDENVDLDYIIKNYTLFPTPSSCLLPLMIERVVMYGYITLFSFHMPIIALFGWIIELIVTKIEVYLLLNSQRPLPRRCQNLGQWEGVIHLLDVIGVITTTVSIGISLGSQGFTTPHAITLTILPIFIIIQCLIRELNRTSGDYIQSHKHKQFKALQKMSRGGEKRDSMIQRSTEL